VALAKMKTTRKKCWRAEKEPSADLRGGKWEQAGTNTCSREQREEKNSFRESFKLAANRDEYGTLPEGERNLLAQDKTRKENFSGKNEGSSMAPTKSTGQAIKEGPLERDSRTRMKNLI
jgi:hypothetical protein